MRGQLPQSARPARGARGFRAGGPLETAGEKAARVGQLWGWGAGPRIRPGPERLLSPGLVGLIIMLLGLLVISFLVSLSRPSVVRVNSVEGLVVLAGGGGFLVILWGGFGSGGVVWRWIRV